MVSFRRRGSIWHFRFVDHEGKQRERKGHFDLPTKKAMARPAEDDVAKLKAGLASPPDPYQVHDSLPLEKHLDDYRAFLRAKGGTEKYVTLLLTRARAVFSAAGFERISELAADLVQSALNSLRGDGLSLGTVNHHRSAPRGFSRWLHRTARRLRDDPLLGVAPYNAEEDHRHDRRTISAEELARLVDVAHRGGPYRLMTGPARSLVYRLAATTGHRYGEIRSLLRESFRLDSAPSVRAPASDTKNGRTAALPITPELADDLAPYLDALPAGAPAFPLPDRGAAMLRVDLAAAEIPYRDAEGYVFDFHALRCELATLAEQAGVSPRVIQRMMRHSTFELTGRYTRLRQADIDAATSKLPSLRPVDQMPNPSSLP